LTEDYLAWRKDPIQLEMYENVTKPNRTAADDARLLELRKLSKEPNQVKQIKPEILKAFGVIEPRNRYEYNPEPKTGRYDTPAIKRFSARYPSTEEIRY
jgi:hypothetical protein